MTNHKAQPVEAAALDLLKPCPIPWCASADVKVERFVCIFRPGDHRDAAVVCQQCKCGTPVKCTEAEAITAWNHRSTGHSHQEPNAGAVERMRAALGPFAKAAEIRLCGGDYWTDEKRIQGTDVAFHITFGDLRRAKEALVPADPKGET